MRKLTFFLILVIVLAFLTGYFLRINQIESLKVSPVAPVTQYVRVPGESFSHIVKRIAPSVVNIEAIKSVKEHSSYSSSGDVWDELWDSSLDKPSDEWEEENIGSGVIVSSDGYIITNYHVVEDAEKIKVTLHNRNQLVGKLVGADVSSDLAIIKVNTREMPTIVWGDSDILNVGDVVLAFGNPYGLRHTVTMGIISALGRGDIGLSDYENFIQTDAAINPGNSGGPLVNANGELIGLNAGIFSRNGGYQGIGFAVPSNMARLVVKDLIDKGKVIRGWLGLTTQEMTPELAEGFGLREIKGVIVVDVTDNSPAGKAKIERGDIILSINGKAVNSASSFRNHISLCPVKSVAHLEVKRYDMVLSINATVEALPDSSDDCPDYPPPQVDDVRGYNEILDCKVIDITHDVALQLGLPFKEKGVIVMSVRSGGAADESGLIKGDIIEEVNRKEIKNSRDFDRILSQMGHEGMTAILFINRNGHKFYISLKTKAS
jgi:serine protease Do